MNIKLMIAIIFSSFNIIAQEKIATLRRTEKATTTRNYTQDKAIQLIRVFKWELYTNNGFIVFGVSDTNKKAISVIEDFTKRNLKTKYKTVNYTIKQTTTENKAYFEEFKELFPKGYKLLSSKDLIALKLISNKEVTKAVQYIGASKSLNMFEAPKYIDNLDSYKKYRFKY